MREWSNQGTRAIDLNCNSLLDETNQDSSLRLDLPVRLNREAELPHSQPIASGRPRCLLQFCEYHTRLQREQEVAGAGAFNYAFVDANRQNHRSYASPSLQNQGKASSSGDVPQQPQSRTRPCRHSQGCLPKSTSAGFSASARHRPRCLSIYTCIAVSPIVELLRIADGSAVCLGSKHAGGVVKHSFIARRVSVPRCRQIV